jgi:hypothetical protein
MGLAVAITAAATAVADEKTDAILKKAIEAHGGADALNKYPARTMEMKGELTFGGMDLAFTGSIKSMAPDRYKLLVDMEIMGMKVAVQQIVKGDKVKSVVNVAGMEMAAGGDDEKDELKLNVAMADAERITPLMDKKRFSVKAGDDEDVKGKKAAVLVVTSEAVKKEFKLYFDKTSGLLVKSSHHGVGPSDGGAPAKVFEETYYSDFKKVNGVQVPTTFEVKHDDKKFMNVTLNNVELKEKLEDTEFAIDD